MSRSDLSDLIQQYRAEVPVARKNPGYGRMPKRIVRMMGRLDVPVCERLKAADKWGESPTVNASSHRAYRACLSDRHNFWQWAKDKGIDLSLVGFKGLSRVSVSVAETGTETTVTRTTSMKYYETSKGRGAKLRRLTPAGDRVIANWASQRSVKSITQTATAKLALQDLGLIPNGDDISKWLTRQSKDKVVQTRARSMLFGTDGFYPYLWGLRREDAHKAAPNAEALIELFFEDTNTSTQDYRYLPRRLLVAKGTLNLSLEQVAAWVKSISPTEATESNYGMYLTGPSGFYTWVRRLGISLSLYGRPVPAIPATPATSVDYGEILALYNAWITRAGATAKQYKRIPRKVLRETGTLNHTKEQILALIDTWGVSKATALNYKTCATGPIGFWTWAHDNNVDLYLVAPTAPTAPPAPQGESKAIARSLIREYLQQLTVTGSDFRHLPLRILLDTGTINHSDETLHAYIDALDVTLRTKTVYKSCATGPHGFWTWLNAKYAMPTPPATLERDEAKALIDLYVSEIKPKGHAFASVPRLVIKRTGSLNHTEAELHALIEGWDIQDSSKRTYKVGCSGPLSFWTWATDMGFDLSEYDKATPPVEEQATQATPPTPALADALLFAVKAGHLTMEMVNEPLGATTTDPLLTHLLQCNVNPDGTTRFKVQTEIQVSPVQ